MALFQSVATYTIAGTSADITATLAPGMEVEIFPRDAGIWVHVEGGTAAVEAADCVFIAKDAWAVIKIPDGATKLTAIRESTTSAKVTTGVIG